jgi:DNA repair protein RecO (recombination protein O)
MLISTRGIVIHTVKFSETSIVAKIFTEQCGLQPYLVKGVRKAHSKLSPGLFQPLTLLDLVVYHKQKTSLQNIREAGYHHPYQNIPFDIRKSSVALFITELIYKTVREEEANVPLFGFLARTCIELDEIQSPGNVYHIVFAIRLASFLGFMPRQNYSPKRKFFNMQEGIFQENIPDHTYYMDEETSRLFSELSEVSTGQAELPRVSSKLRDLLLEKIIHYYQLHIPGFTGMKSHLVLHSVLS